MKRPVARKTRKTPIKTAAKTSAKTAAQTSAKIPAKTPVKINPAISAEVIPDDGKKPSAAAKAVAPAQNTEPVVAAVSGEAKSKSEPKDQSREKSRHGAGNETKAGDKDDVKDTDKDETRDKSKHAPLEEELENPKLVHGIFVMSKKEYKALRKLKKDCKKAGVKVKKSELLRVGMALLNKQAPEEIQALISGLAPLKAGRLNKVK